MQTPQLYMLFGCFLGVATGGLALIGVSKVMMGEIFTKSLPDIVTPAFTSNYVLMLSVASVIGRLFW